MKILELISAITAFQLIELGVILLTSKRGNRLSNRILSVFMFSNALLVGWFAFGNRIYENLPLDTLFYFLLAPYLYLYVKSLCVNGYKRGVWESLHWLPAVLAFIYGLWNPEGYFITQILLDVQIAIYLLLIFRVIATYRKEIREHFSTVGKIDLSWLRFILLAFVLMWSVDIIAMIVKGSFALSIVSLSINFIFATSIVFRGLKHPHVFSGIKEAAKYSGSALSKQKSIEHATVLKRVMTDEKPFLNPDLTIKELADQLSIHPKSLSQVINSYFQQNFFDFVNYYRVEEAKSIMVDGSNKTILEVLYEVGYNSKSAFNEAFKKETRMTPTEYRKMYKNGSLS